MGGDRRQPACSRRGTAAADRGATRGPEALPEPIPAGATLERAFTAASSHCRTTRRRALVVAAVALATRSRAEDDLRRARAARDRAGRARARRGRRPDRARRRPACLPASARPLRRLPLRGAVAAPRRAPRARGLAFGSRRSRAARLASRRRGDSAATTRLPPRSRHWPNRPSSDRAMQPRRPRMHVLPSSAPTSRRDCNGSRRRPRRHNGAAGRTSRSPSRRAAGRDGSTAQSRCAPPAGADRLPGGRPTRGDGAASRGGSAPRERSTGSARSRSSPRRASRSRSSATRGAARRRGACGGPRPRTAGTSGRGGSRRSRAAGCSAMRAGRQTACR